MGVSSRRGDPRSFHDMSKQKKLAYAKIKNDKHPSSQHCLQ